MRQFAAGEITNDEYVDAWPHSSPDRAVKAIWRALWFVFDDLREHRLVGRDALSVDGERLLERCAAFLETDLEYEWRAATLLTRAAKWPVRAVDTLEKSRALTTRPA